MATHEDDLYGDLDDAVAKPASSGARRSTPAACAAGAHSTISPPEIAQLRRQIKALNMENDILKKNIGILYRTCRSELDRKDRTIDQLQNELDSLRR